MIMNDVHEDFRRPIPFVLAPQQVDVLQALQGKEYERYPLSQWYLGFLYALDNNYNPDRIAQAAQSLRELIEKLPRVVLAGDLKFKSRNIPELRRDMVARIAKDRKRYPEGWEGKPIDPHLAKTLDKASVYFDEVQFLVRKAVLLG